MGDSEDINFAALERELQCAVEADKKYRRENDAKFRAIRQNVGSYEEFRDIVLASHLKPLERKDKRDGSRKQPWNSIASATRQPSTSQHEEMEASEFHPRTAAEFIRDWRRFGGSTEDRYRLLVSLGGEGLRRIFVAEVGAGLLGEFLLVLSECLRPTDAASAVAVLEGMSRTGRFGLNVSFLSRAERDACRRLARRLMDIAADAVPENAGGQAMSRGPRGATGHRGGDVVEKLKSVMQLYGVDVDSPE
ncbi:hypothetical protein AAFF_G00341770 [Aldrovandia affinis]|uniref:Coiled-coil domain-containing protein 103 n=1 Tax=Aldrovandia affinis TaxID=143900 RepID=A0AAD7SKR4_9TELE|nr:hypothetical protein AAFF_G00341770 [Aldrovandia affinis]